jgi:rod shape-determining protein MreB
LTGKEILTGIPKTFFITDEEVREALQEPINIIVESVKRALEKTPPDLAADIYERGIWLAGGGALLKGLDQLIQRETTLAVHVADDPLTAIVRGAGAVIEDMEYYKPVFIS